MADSKIDGRSAAQWDYEQRRSFVAEGLISARLRSAPCWWICRATNGDRRSSNTATARSRDVARRQGNPARGLRLAASRAIGSIVGRGGARRAPEGGGRWPAGHRHRRGFHQLHHAAGFRDGTPLCLLPEYRPGSMPGRSSGSTTGPSRRPSASIAWRATARSHGCPLRRNHRPGVVLSKILETLEAAPQRLRGRRSVAGGWRLDRLAIGRRRCRGVAARPVRRATRPCGTGPTAILRPSSLRRCDPRMAGVVADKMPGRLLSPGHAPAR